MFVLSYTQAAFLGLLQGVTELFPISSLGHSVLLPHILGWNINLEDPQFLSFLVLTHLATALVLLGFFWRDWLNIILGVLRSLFARKIDSDDVYARLGWLLLVSTIPAGLLGLLFEKKVQALFGATAIIAGALFLNGIALYVGELLRRRAEEGKADDTKIAGLSWANALFIGVAQCFALVPGFSRTGFTISGGLLVGLSHENAARYSFLMATPIILAAAVLKVPHLFSEGAPLLGQAIVGAFCSGAAAYISIRFLLKYFETKTLTPFAIYCMCAGAVSLLLFAQ